MSGEQGCQVEDSLAKLQQVINNQNAKVGLRDYIYNPEVDDILGLDVGQLRCLSAIQCGEYAFILSQFALYIQLETNKFKIINDWCDNAISRLLAKEYTNYGDKFTPYEAKKNMFINGNDMAKKIIEIKKNYNTKLETWFNISNLVKFMSDRLTELQRSKKRDYGN